MALLCYMYSSFNWVWHEVVTTNSWIFEFKQLQSGNESEKMLGIQIKMASSRSSRDNRGFTKASCAFISRFSHNIKINPVEVQSHNRESFYLEELTCSL